MAGSFSEEHEFDALVETIQAALREMSSAREEDVREWVKQRMGHVYKEEKVIKAG